MTTLDSRSGWTRLGSARLAALVGGITLAASMTFGTAVGPASAETAAEFLASRCANYIANPQPYEAARSHCDGADLSGVDLSGVDLSWAFLTEANLTDTDLTGTDLHGAYMADANLANATLTGANLTEANLTRANLTGANLTGANLTDLNLTGSALVPADITVDVMDAGWSYDGAYVTWATPSMPTGVEFGACDYPSGTKFPTELTVVKCDVATSSSGSYGYFTVYVIPGPNWGEPPVTGSLGSLNSFFGS
ncbi:pentapeptide repeat-containing protein [Rhodococcus sp. AD45-ID]|uniref:pentapeptide repeat-containing protein n=2 Tax=unclassified Rhodococcus (in: high G+C Gram-positive bacteria) TaxID=192944 RepID=UPI0005E35B25|nr:pentapeptide repeat-containing protein [Rhodococcus sp. AD45]KJF20976.1 Type III effector pipB2 [Rhodococcus sp. AD45]PSR38530.1 pentapeptide repeat-containing protein [Rhodococcus sp. AD45-ID]